MGSVGVLVLVALAICGLGEAAGLKYQMVIGARKKLTLWWTPDAANGSIDICVTTDANHGQWVAIGFAPDTLNHMANTDIVAGWTANGAGNVKSLYALNATGFPAGTPTLTISGQSFTEDETGQKLCFTRPLNGGHNPLKDGSNLIWAVGPVTADGTPGYHGSDPQHMPNDNRTHRSDEVPPIPWMSGPKFKYERTIGAARGLKLSWTPDATAGSLMVCVSCVGNQGGWLGIGFSPNPPNHMQNTDIVWGFAANGAGTVATAYALNATGYPGGESTLKVTATSFTETADGLQLCFTRPFTSGHHNIDNNGEIIWATGPVTDGAPGYHGSDPHAMPNDDRMHRSDEVPVIQWLTGY